MNLTLNGEGTYKGDIHAFLGDPDEDNPERFDPYDGELHGTVRARVVTATQFAGCQFLTVEAYHVKGYSAVGFYEKCGFAPNELPNPNKDTLRMFKTLYSK